MQSKQYFTKIKNYPHEKSTEPLYSPPPETVVIRRTDRPEGRKRLVRLMKRRGKLKKRMQGLKTGGDNIRGQVFDRCAKSSRIMTGPLSPTEFSD